MKLRRVAQAGAAVAATSLLSGCLPLAIAYGAETIAQSNVDAARIGALGKSGAPGFNFYVCEEFRDDGDFVVEPGEIIDQSNFAFGDRITSLMTAQGLPPGSSLKHYITFGGRKTLDYEGTAHGTHWTMYRYFDGMPVGQGSFQWEVNGQIVGERTFKVQEQRRVSSR